MEERCGNSRPVPERDPLLFPPPTAERRLLVLRYIIPDAPALGLANMRS